MCSHTLLIADYFGQVPIVKPDKAVGRKLGELVNSMQGARLTNINTIPIEREIDEIVFRLFDLTPSEIALVREVAGAAGEEGFVQTRRVAIER